MSRGGSVTSKVVSCGPSLGGGVGDQSLPPPPLGSHSVSVGSSMSTVASGATGLTISVTTGAAGAEMASQPPAGKVGGPPLRRTSSYSSQVGGGGIAESRRAAIAEMISHIRNYDPYPCILGIPVMPALFSTSKFYIFISFMMIGARVLVEKWKDIQKIQDM